MREPSAAEQAARGAIVATLQAYARGVDRGDWDLVRSCYHPDAVDDHGVYRGGPEGFVDYFSAVKRSWDRTCHYVFEPWIELDGDRAAVDSMAVAHHLAGADDLVMGARYSDDFRRRDGDWRILRRVVTVEWIQQLPADLPHWEFADRFARPAPAADGSP